MRSERPRFGGKPGLVVGMEMRAAAVARRWSPDDATDGVVEAHAKQCVIACAVLAREQAKASADEDELGRPVCSTRKLAQLDALEAVVARSHKRLERAVEARERARRGGGLSADDLRAAVAMYMAGAAELQKLTGQARAALAGAGIAIEPTNPPRPAPTPLPAPPSSPGPRSPAASLPPLPPGIEHPAAPAPAGD